MLTVINIKSKKAIKEIALFRAKNYALHDIRIKNIELKRINDYLNFRLFYKNDLFINSATLWELMQPLGKSGSHNYHNLTPTDIYYFLLNINSPSLVYRERFNRIVVASDQPYSSNERLIMIIEVNASLIVNKNANIYKIVTIYPKSDLEKTIQKLKPSAILLNKLK